MPQRRPDTRALVAAAVPYEVRLWLAAADLGVKASYRVDEIARLLSISERTVYRMICYGRLEAIGARHERADAEGMPRVGPTRIPLGEVLRMYDGE